METDNRINILPEEIAHKIAAGEVVERPASVVKELIENSLDAKATAINIEVKNAGKTLISVKDNGIGIHPEDLEKAFIRYATSKISTVKDLFNIKSLGFRGEALYSISAVSRTILRSKFKDQIGWEIEVRAGKITTKRPTSMTQGTEVKVLNLFFNTPARLKFLKSDRTENRHIINLILPYCLIFDKINFTLKIDNRYIINKLPPGLTARIEALLGLNPKNFISAQSFLPTAQLNIKALLSDSNIRRSQRNMQFIFVNNRPVVIPKLLARINKTYRCILPEGYHPAFIIFLNLPAENIDVNIHPTKREVRFKNEDVLIHQITSFIEHKLLSSARPTYITLRSSQSHSISNTLSGSPIKPDSTEMGSSHNITNSFEKNLYSQPLNLQPQNLNSHSNLPVIKEVLLKGRSIGIFMNKYGLLEYQTTLYLIDIHAGQERINYEKLIRKFDNPEKLEIQHLLTPFTLTLSINELNKLKELKNFLTDLGFDIRFWKGNTVAIQSHPKIIKDPQTALRQLLEEQNLFYEITQIKEILARKACRTSLMAGDKISIENLRIIVEELTRCKNPTSCPHGRPIIIGINDDVLETMFLRKKGSNLSLNI